MPLIIALDCSLDQPAPSGYQYTTIFSSQNKGRNPLVKTNGIDDVVNNVMHCPFEIVASVADR